MQTIPLITLLLILTFSCDPQKSRPVTVASSSEAFTPTFEIHQESVSYVDVSGGEDTHVTFFIATGPNPVINAKINSWIFTKLYHMTQEACFQTQDHSPHHLRSCIEASRANAEPSRYGETQLTISARTEPHLHRHVITVIEQYRRYGTSIETDVLPRLECFSVDAHLGEILPIAACPGGD